MSVSKGMNKQSSIKMNRLELQASQPEGLRDNMLPEERGLHSRRAARSRTEQCQACSSRGTHVCTGVLLGTGRLG